MPYKRRSRTKNLKIFLTRTGIVAAVVLLCIAITLLVRSLIPQVQTIQKEPPIQIAQTDIQEPDATSEISGKYYGLCKKNSIHSVEDFKRTVQQDATLSSHFAGFNWESAKLGKLDNPVWTFVSYRKGEIIRRTSKPVKLPKGDGYITDGIRTVRTYCCNDYVSAPAPVELSMAEPAPQKERVDGPPRRAGKQAENTPQMFFDTANEDPIRSLPEPLQNVSFDSFHSGSPFLDHPTFTNHSSSTNGPPGDKPVPTPEPGTLFLLGGGFGALALMQMLRKKNEPHKVSFR